MTDVIKYMRNMTLKLSSCLTLFWYDVECDGETGVFYQLHNVGVWHTDDGLSIHSQDPVAHLQLPTAVCRAALDYTSDFVRHSWKRAIIRWLSTPFLKTGVLTVADIRYNDNP